MGVARSTLAALRDLGHDVEHLAEVGLEKLSDREVLHRAAKERRAVITFDLDFGDLIAASGRSLPSVIVLRLADQRPVSATPRILSALTRFGEALEKGALLVIEDARVRLRRLPLDPDNAG
jgi:predicted nuclease of predicted toxin-antitoxin system